MSFRLSVEGVADGGAIPRRYTCEGENVSPALQWSGEPKGTRSYALIVDDPDAPAGTWTHWLLWDIPAETHSLETGYRAADGVRSGSNDFRKTGYGGPCPPKGHGAHRYYFSLYALDVPELDVPPGAGRAALETAVARHTVGTARTMGRFERR